MFRWANDMPDLVSFDPATVLKFIESRWGLSHYVASLTRYMLAAHRLRNSRTGPVGPDVTRRALYAGEPLVLSPRCSVLRNLHDCPELMSLLESHTSHLDIPKRLRSGRKNFLVFVGSSDEVIRNFVLDRATADFVGKFVTPVRVSRARKSIHGNGMSQSKTKLVEQLIELGAITAGAQSEQGPYEERERVAYQPPVAVESDQRIVRLHARAPILYC
jgi:hypothetical protein